MRRKYTAALLPFCLLGLLAAGIDNLLAQETEGRKAPWGPRPSTGRKAPWGPRPSTGLLERILNPLPDYDPFDKPPPSLQFFPDDVDKRARATMIDSLTYKEESLEGHLRFFTERDAQLKKERRTVTGLTEHVLDLHNNTFRDRERYLEAQKKALSLSLSPKHRQLVESRIQNDDLNRANELLRQSGANRWGAMFNRLLSSVDLVSILSGSYVGAAVDSTMSQLLAIGSAEIPIEERKALTFYLEHLKRYPNDPQNGLIQKRVEALKKKKQGVLLQRQIEKAQEAMGKGELNRAAFHYDIAAFIDPTSREAKDGSEQLRKSLRQQEEERKKGLSVATDQPRTPKPPEGPALSGLLHALTLRDPEQIEAQAKALEEKYRGNPLGESAKDASAVALEITGQHEEAKKILHQIARSSHAPHEKSRAELLLKDPEYNLLASFRDARSQHRLQTVKYVLLGEDFLKKNLLFGTAPLIASGPAGATSVAAANVIMIGTNLFEVLTANPVSNQAVIDRGVAYVRSHPQSESATEVYGILADAYEELGMYDRAIAYHEMSGKVAEKKSSDLKEKAAKTLLMAAEKSGERSLQESYLKAILDDYPESSAAKEATQKLSALAKIDNQGLRMSKQFLMENSELFGPQGLRLKPTLFDGSLSNMELADRGVSLLSEREILLHFQTPWGIRSQLYPLEKEASDRFQITLRKKNYDVAIGNLHARAKGSQGGIKNLPLPLLRGEVERRVAESGDDPTLALVREATGPSPAFPKVLDHQLLSENEKNPGGGFKLPPIQGSISASRFDMSGSLPAGLWGNRVTLGTDEKSPFAGLQLPIPLLQGFIPVDFLLQGRPGRFSIFPKIHLYKESSDDQDLYR